MVAAFRVAIGYKGKLFTSSAGFSRYFQFYLEGGNFSAIAAFSSDAELRKGAVLMHHNFHRRAHVFPRQRQAYPCRRHRRSRCRSGPPPSPAVSMSSSAFCPGPWWDHRPIPIRRSHCSQSAPNATGRRCRRTACASQRERAGRRA